MKINQELLGKEVIDESGEQVGIVKEVEWNHESNKVEYIVLKEGGLSAKLGLGEKQRIPYESVTTIGEKILIKGHLFPDE